MNRALILVYHFNYNIFGCTAAALCEVSCFQTHSTWQKLQVLIKENETERISLNSAARVKRKVKGVIRKGWTEKYKAKNNGRNRWVRKGYFLHVQHCSSLRNHILSLLLLPCASFVCLCPHCTPFTLKLPWYCPTVLGKYFFPSILEGVKHMRGYWHYTYTLN